MYSIYPECGLNNGRLFEFETVSSTNQWAIDHMEMLRHGDVIWAKEQTNGKGRLNSEWSSQKDRDLTISVILEKPNLPEQTPLYAMIMPVAVHLLLEQWGIPSLLKWPNDVMAGQAKICGILSETCSKSDLMVIGTGLNVNSDEKDLKQIKSHYAVTSVFLEKKQIVPVRQLISSLINIIARLMEMIQSKGMNEILSLWRQKDWLADTMIHFYSGTEWILGKYMGIASDGRIKIKNDTTNEMISFWSGEIKNVHKY